MMKVNTFEYELIYLQPRLHACNRRKATVENKMYAFSAKDFDEARTIVAAFLAEGAITCCGRPHEREFVQLTRLKVEIPVKRFGALAGR